MSSLQERRLWPIVSVQENTDSTRRYPLNHRARRQQVSSLCRRLLALFLVSLVIDQLVLPLLLPSSPGADRRSVEMAGALVTLAIAVALVSVALGRIFCSFLEITPQGLRYRIWPGYQIHCGWNDIDRLVSAEGRTDRELLLLSHADIAGLPGIRGMLKPSWTGKRPHSVQLALFAGWETGELLEDLCWYVPQLNR